MAIPFLCFSFVFLSSLIYLTDIIFESRLSVDLIYGTMQCKVCICTFQFELILIMNYLFQYGQVIFDTPFRLSVNTDNTCALSLQNNIFFIISLAAYKTTTWWFCMPKWSQRECRQIKLPFASLFDGLLLQEKTLYQSPPHSCHSRWVCYYI